MTAEVMPVRRPLRFGLGLPTGFPIEREPNLAFLDLAERAEDLGYDSLWAGDHVVFHVPRFEIFTVLAAVAARTSRVTIGSAVLLLCLRNPVHVAQTVATIDHLSRGRFVLGVGVGGEHPKEFEVSGVPVRERGARTDEALDVLRRLWTSERTSFAGRFHAFEDLPATLQPFRRPHPPIWIGGRSPAALRRAAEFGDGWFPGFVTAEGFRERSTRLDELCSARARNPRDVARALFLFACVDRDAARARAQAADFLSRNYAMPFAPFERYTVAGGPAECAAAVLDFVRAGVEDLTVRFASRDPLRQLELWTDEVMPRIRAAV